MGWAQHASGDQTATLDTEHTLGTDPDLTDGTFVLCVDLTNMVAADVLLLRWYEKTTGTGDTQRSSVIGSIAGAQTNDFWQSIPFVGIHGWKFTLEQTDGTGRSYDWSIRSIT